MVRDGNHRNRALGSHGDRAFGRKGAVAGGAGGWSPNVPLLSDCEMYDPSTGLWTATVELGTPRAQHTATLLPDGRVLAAGGQDVNNDGLSACEIYDETKGVWTAAASLADGRYCHTASLLSGGGVLAAGGQGGNGVLSTCETFDSSGSGAAPGVPTGVTASAGDSQATVSFTAPSSNGGSVITGYTVTSSPGSLWAKGTSSPLTVKGLTNGQAYTFTVTAANENGSGLASAPSNCVTPSASTTIPGAPTNVTATACNGQAIVSFTAPSSDGGSVITGYTVTSSPGSLTAKGTSSPITVKGLTNGQAYTFTVTAANKYGSSPASGASNPATPATAPCAPGNVTAVAGNGQATVSFTAPQNNGSPITGYTVLSHPGNISAAGTGTSITVQGLSNGTSYSFTVSATNGVGPGPASKASNSVKPSGPAAQGSLTVTIVGPISSGAQWRADSGAWHGSGATVNLPVGTHKVTFSPVTGWVAPGAQSVTVANGGKYPIVGTYVQPLTFKLPGSLGSVQQCEQFYAPVGPPTGGAGPPYTYSLGSGGFPPLNIFVKTDLSPNTTGTVYGLAVSPPKTYNFQVCVADVASTVKCSSTSITVLAPVKPGTPSSPSPANGAQGVSPSGVSLSWTEAGNTDSYDVYFGSTSKPSLAATLDAPPYKPGVLKAKTTYYWQVVSKHSMCNGLNPTVTKGPVWSFTTSNLTFDLPASLGAVPECGQFNHQVATPSFGTAPYTFSAGTGTVPTGLTIEANGQIDGTVEETPATYPFNVCATDATQVTICEPTSIQVTAAASPGTVSGPTPANGATGVSTGAGLSWSSASNADEYEVYFGTSLPGAPVARVSTPAYSPGALNANTTYHWKIRAVHKMCGLLPDPYTDGPEWSFTTTANPLSITISSATCTQACYLSGPWDTLTVTGTACGDVNASIETGLETHSCPSWDQYCQRESTQPACTGFTASGSNDLAGQTRQGSITLWSGDGSSSIDAPWTAVCPPNTCH